MSKKLSLYIDALHNRIDELSRLPKNSVRNKAIAQLKQKLRNAEKKIPS